MQYTADLVHKHQVHAPQPGHHQGRRVGKPQLPQWHHRHGVGDKRVSRSAVGPSGSAAWRTCTSRPPPQRSTPFIANLGQNTAMFKTSSQQQGRCLAGHAPGSRVRNRQAHYARPWTFFLPPRKSVLTTPEYAQNLKDVPQFKTFVDALDYGYRPFHPEFPPRSTAPFQNLVSAAELEGAALGEGRPGPRRPASSTPSSTSSSREPASRGAGRQASESIRHRVYPGGVLRCLAVSYQLSAVSHWPGRESSDGGHWLLADC